MWWCDLIWFIFATDRYRFDQLTYVDRDLHQSRLPRDFYRIPVCTHRTAALLCSGYSCRTHLHFHLFLWQLWGHSGSWRHGHSTHILWDKLKEPPLRVIITLLSAIMLINTHTHTHTHTHTLTHLRKKLRCRLAYSRGAMVGCYVMVDIVHSSHQLYSFCIDTLTSPVRMWWVRVCGMRCVGRVRVKCEGVVVIIKLSPSFWYLVSDISSLTQICLL